MLGQVFESCFRLETVCRVDDALVLNFEGLFAESVGIGASFEHEADGMSWRESFSEVEGDELTDGAQSKDMKSHVTVVDCTDMKTFGDVRRQDNIHNKPSYDQ